jgi:hypothetical protein
MLILISFIAILVLCFYQDVRFRGVHWFVFPLVLAGAIALNWVNLNWTTIAYNTGFLTVLLLGLTLYLTAKEQRLVNIIKGYFSMGDILFLVAMIPLFSFQWYILFFTFGTILTLVFHLIAATIKPQKTIPYAGYMALVGIAYVTFSDQLQNLIPSI